MTKEKSDQLLIHSFAVGHGDCTLLEYKQENQIVFRMLCDAGTKAPDELIAHLKKNRKVTAGNNLPDIDLVILSHVDGDHQGGLHDLFNNNEITISEYWGPCLPAFRRYGWLFGKRVQKAVSNAVVLEDAIKAKTTKLIYPMEGFVARPIKGRVAISVLSPPASLLRRLVTGNEEDISELFTNTPLPLEWLISGAPFDEDEENTEFNIFPSSKTFAEPKDFPNSFESFNDSAKKDGITKLVKEKISKDSIREPEFFGNHVLNDTSLVVAVDVFLDGRHRRRVLLTGDQENWAYIASRHPSGLGVDVLKAPHHGGQVYIADIREYKNHAIEQLYLWMRPRSVIVSASGQYGLPHFRFRETLRAVGSALVCPNTRSFEPLTAGSVYEENKSCYKAYNCSPDKTQRKHSITTLSGQHDHVNASACLQGNQHAGTAPIVVLEQRIVEPDETFIRWTHTEIEKHAKWIKDKLHARHSQFKAAMTRTAESLLPSMRESSISQKNIEAAAKACGRHQLAADPVSVIKYGAAQGLFWSTKLSSKYDTCELYRRSTKKEMEDIRRWITSMPNILLHIQDLDWDDVTGQNSVKLINSSELTTLCALIAGKLLIPYKFAEKEVMPIILDDLTKHFSARLCDASRVSNVCTGKYDSPKIAWLHLFKGFSVIPDIASEEWNTKLWNNSSDNYYSDATNSNLKFMLGQAESAIFIPSCLTEMDTKNPKISKKQLGGFFNTWSSQYWQSGIFVHSFESAQWHPAWQAQTQ
jgi:hypothetical protein